MRPPICAICHKNLGPGEGGLVYFAKSELDLKWDTRMQEEHLVGHPPYIEWFCEDHIIVAKKYSNLTRVDAIKKIKSNL